MINMCLGFMQKFTHKGDKDIAPTMAPENIEILIIQKLPQGMRQVILTRQLYFEVSMKMLRY